MLKRLTFGTLVGGSSQGVIGYTLTFDGKPGTPRQLAELIRLLQGHPSIDKFKVFSLEGAAPNEDDMYSFAKRFPPYSREEPLGYKYRIVMPADATDKYIRVASHCHSVCAVITSPDWLAFKCHELWYVPKEGKPIVEPAMPREFILRDEAGNTYGEMILFIKGAGVGTLKFISTAKHRWRIDLPVTPIEQVLYEEDK